MDIAKRLREAMPQAVPRKVIKQTVMTTVYGVTMYGAVLQIKRQLKAIDINSSEVTSSTVVVMVVLRLPSSHPT